MKILVHSSILFLFFLIFGMSGSYILFWKKKKLKKCFLTILKLAFSVSRHNIAREK